MKCRKHPEDYSSSSGICASCLRQRLVALIAAQAAQGDHFKEDERESEPNPLHLNFPQSVSPYIFRRKSETAQEFRRHDIMQNYNCLPDRKFFSTPQIGPTARVTVDDNLHNKQKGRRKFWLFSTLFRSKSEINSNSTDLDPRASNSAETTASTSRSWFSKRKQRRTFSLDEAVIGNHRRGHRRHGRGMSPAGCSDEESEANMETPKMTPVRHGGGRRRNLSRNVSEIVFCLSPLVRPSPNRVWNQKGGGGGGGGLGPEIGGEARVSVKPPPPNLSKNRSRKLADFGRCKRHH